MNDRVRSLILLVSGVVLGAIGAYVGKDKIDSALVSTGMSKLAEANTCQPTGKAADDGIFFVSCGGIY